MKRTVSHIFAFLLLALTLVACASTSPVSQVQNPQTTGAVQKVTIASFAFDPPSLTVPVGTTVTWTNQDQTDHTVTANDNSFDSGQFGQGESFSFTFSKEGTFPYKCLIHPSMLGTIIVTK